MSRYCIKFLERRLSHQAYEVSKQVQSEIKEISGSLWFIGNRTYLMLDLFKLRQSLERQTNITLACISEQAKK